MLDLLREKNEYLYEGIFEVVDEADVADNLRDGPGSAVSPPISLPEDPVIWDSDLPREAMLAAELATVWIQSTQERTWAVFVPGDRQPGKFAHGAKIEKQRLPQFSLRSRGFAHEMN